MAPGDLTVQENLESTSMVETLLFRNVPLSSPYHKYTLIPFN